MISSHMGSQHHRECPFSNLEKKEGSRTVKKKKKSQETV